MFHGHNQYFYLQAVVIDTEIVRLQIQYSLPEKIYVLLAFQIL